MTQLSAPDLSHKNTFTYFVLPGIGTGAERSFSIHVSISFTSCITIDDVVSVANPVKTFQTLSLKFLQFHYIEILSYIN